MDKKCHEICIKRFLNDTNLVQTAFLKLNLNDKTNQQIN